VPNISQREEKTFDTLPTRHVRTKDGRWKIWPSNDAIFSWLRHICPVEFELTNGDIRIGCAVS
jgi:hypothetical protein